MDCQTTENGLSEYLDDELPSGDRREVGLHLAECRECQTHLEQMHAVRRDLQRLPRAKVPADLTMRLRIEASRHRSLTPQPSAWGLFWMRINQFLRPLMVPACGGLLSSVVLFTTTFIPAVPDCCTSWRALARSGALHLVPGFFVYGQ
jgi:anti-sigma factor RsiW